MRVVEVDYGLGTYYNDRIEINKNLPEDLKQIVLEHEMQHTNNFSIKEFLSHKPIFNVRLWVWMFNNPKSFYNFFPYRKGYWDVDLIIGYTIFIGVIVLCQQILL